MIIKQIYKLLAAVGMPYIKILVDKGYKYIFMPKDSNNEFYATKAIIKKDGFFINDVDFDIFKLKENETFILQKGKFINLVD